MQGQTDQQPGAEVAIRKYVVSMDRDTEPRRVLKPPALAPILTCLTCYNMILQIGEFFMFKTQ